MAIDSIYALNIERAVLSSILFDPELIEDVLGIVKPTDFYLMAHQKIFEVMEQLNHLDLPIDEEFIKKRVSSKDVDENGISSCISSALREIMDTIKCDDYIFDGNSSFGIADLPTMVKADLKILEVGAASILAKVARDRAIKDIKEEYNIDFGSGYPSDQKTREFLKENWNKYNFFRKTWEPYKKIAGIKKQTKLGVF